jgi:ElaB/YqjD/DUF883 family membrane-anchored ribosome-binding protein
MMNQRNDQTVAHQAADVVDNLADGVRSVAHTAHEAAGRAVSAVGERYDQAGQYARDSVSHGRDRVRSWGSNLECSVRENPKTAILLAAVLGGILFGFWRRH